MPTQLQFRRGTTSQNNSFTGAVGEISIDTATDAIILHDGSSAGGIEIVPSGTIVAFGNTTAPTGWLACNDAAISRSTYARLFATIGTSFGVGDGSSNFNVPDLRDRVPLGYGSNMTSLGAATTGIAASAVMASASKSDGSKKKEEKKDRVVTKPKSSRTKKVTSSTDKSKNLDTEVKPSVLDDQSEPVKEETKKTRRRGWWSKNS